MKRGSKSVAWILSQRELTQDQKKAVELPVEQHQLIVGPPGSGKTQILVHRAYYLCKKYDGLSPDYRIFVFTNALKKYIKDGIEWMGLPQEKVMTFDAWCREYHKQHISASLPGGASQYDEIRQAVLKHTKNLQRPMFDFVMVELIVLGKVISISNGLSGMVTYKSALLFLLVDNPCVPRSGTDCELST